MKEQSKEVKNLIWFFSRLINEIFKVSLVAYLIFLLIETFSAGFISNYLNLNIILVVCVISGIIDFLVQKGKKLEKRKLTRNDFIWILTLSVIGALFILRKTIELGWISYLISFASGVLIVLISVLIIESED